MAPAFEGRITPPAVLESIARQGLLGKKSGRGFYVYGDGVPRPNAEVAALQRPGAAARLSREELAERMALPLLNEATRVLGEGIVAAPEDVDLGMILGTGFAPFRGGPLRTLDALGARTVLARLTALEQAHGARFRPSALLAELARDGKTIYHDAPARRVPEKAAV
jgi:3-hydroxyacyl-CoA dehydrogenase